MEVDGGWQAMKCLQMRIAGCKVKPMQFFFSPRFTPSYRYWRFVAASVE
jgi:hypothetical protein